MNKYQTDNLGNQSPSAKDQLLHQHNFFHMLFFVLVLEQPPPRVCSLFLPQIIQHNGKQNLKCVRWNDEEIHFVHKTERLSD